jgi:hypothetical protein
MREAEMEPRSAMSLPLPPLDPESNPVAIIHISWSQATGSSTRLSIDHQMEFEAKEPAHSRLAASGLPCKDPMLADAFGMTISQEVESMNLKPVHAPDFLDR